MVGTLNKSVVKLVKAGVVDLDSQLSKAVMGISAAPSLGEFTRSSYCT